jgi:prevent-host-death family protein
MKARQMAVSVTGEQLQKNTGFVRSEARRQPVRVTYHGRPELVIVSVEDYELLRQNRKAVYRIEDMSIEKIERIAENKMDEHHVHLNALMDD